MNPERFTKIAWCVLGAAVLAAALPAAAFFGPKGDSPEEKRAHVLQQRDEMLAVLFSLRPDLKKRIGKAPGYATFSSLAMKLGFTSSERGYGVLVDNDKGTTTFMKMASFGVGAGAGIKDQRLVIVFKDREMMKRFVEEGWQFGAQADAGAKVDDEGVGANLSGSTSSAGTAGAAGMGVTSDDEGASGPGTATSGEMEIYLFTDTGVSLSATVSGTKYWKDSKLNG